MKKYFKFIISTILNYKFYAIPIVFYEIYFNLIFDRKLNKFKYFNDKYLSDSIPCSYYLLKKINNFIRKNQIKYVCDIGSGYGKILYFIGNVSETYIDGIELEKSVFDESKKLESDKIKVYNKDIFSFRFDNKNYDLLIFNDPLKKPEDLSKILKNINNLSYNFFLIFINLSFDKKNIVKELFEIIYKEEFSDTRNYMICKKK
tara:strand:+ start:23 stop:631 length:609 start_codon:yes stop_codon:yes gene_type:complete